MALFALSLIALLLITLLLGVHLTGYLALNPALRTMDAQVHVPVKRAIDVTAPRFARPLMLCCLVGVAAAAAAGALAGAVASAVASTVAMGALVTALVAILRGDLPINRAMAGWSADQPPAHWRATRARWEYFFTLRTAANAVAMLAASVAVGLGAVRLA